MDEISRWINDLNSSKTAERAAAAEGLARLGEQARPAAVGLVRNVGDPDENLREWCSAALEELGKPALEDRAALIDLADSRDADTAYWAITLLGRLGTEAAPAVERLAEIAGDTGTDPARPAAARQRAVWALGRIGPPAAAAREALEKASRSDDPRLARLARHVLERLATP